MKHHAVLLLAVLAVAGCTVPIGTPPARCQLLPDPPRRATRLQLEHYAAEVVRLYGECAGGPAANAPDLTTSPSTPQ